LLAALKANLKEEQTVSLWKRGNIWWTYFYIDGARHQVSTGTNNRKQAEAVEQKLKAEANARRHQLVEFDAEMTFAALAARFLSSAGVKPYHPDRLKQVLQYFAEVPVTRITKAMVREYRLYRQALKPVSEATINRDIAVLRHVLYWAVDESLLLSNPLTRLTVERERRERRPVMTVKEEEQLLEVVPEHLQKMIVTALDTGMRRGEILHQLWEHVDLERRILFVTKSKTPGGEAREIPMTTRLVNLLSGLCRETGLVFTYKQQPVRSIKTSWNRAVQNAAIRRFRFHDLRHTFNTRLLEAGVMQEVRMVLMGHSSGRSMNAVYSHIELPLKREAIARLETWVNQKLQQRRKEETHASTETARSETGTDQVRRSQAVEEEDTRRGGPGAGRQAEGRNRRNGGRTEDQAQAASEIRGGQKAL
jgi:integrase